MGSSHSLSVLRSFKAPLLSGLMCHPARSGDWEIGPPAVVTASWERTALLKGCKELSWKQPGP